MDIEQFIPYRNGEPVGYVYQESNHPASYQVIRRDKEDRLVNTTKIDELALAVKEISGIVWLTQAQIDMLDAPLGKHAMRSLNPDEEAQIAA